MHSLFKEGPHVNYLCLHITHAQAEIKTSRGTKPAAAKAPAEVVASLEHPVPVSDEVIYQLLVTGPTAESRPRVQICGKSKSCSRVFITTVSPQTFPKWNLMVCAMHEEVSGQAATKHSLLAVKSKYS